MNKSLIILVVLICLFAINMCLVPNFVNATEEVKLNTLKFNATEVDVDKVSANADKTVTIPVTLDFSGDVAMVTVLFENEKGDKYGPCAIYIDSYGKKDLEIQSGQPLVAGTTYYLTDIFFMKKVENGYDIQKRYVTKKSNASANGYDIVEFDYGYSFKVYSSNVDDGKKEDNTVAKDIIPQTGDTENMIIVLTIMVIGIISIIILVKYKKMKDI